MTESASRTIAHQDTAQLGGRLSILARQRADHEHLDRLIARVRETRATGGIEHRVALRALTRLVATHAFAEEAVLFPRRAPGTAAGDALTLHIEEDHQQVNELLSRVERGDDSDPARPEALERLFAALDDDVRTEEDQLLPALQQRMTTRQLRLVGLQWEVLRRISPTRPHPIVSRRPPGQVLSALPLTVLDRTRDAAQQLDEVTRGRFAGALAQVDRGLGVAARWVESRSLLRRGERAETRV